MFRKIKIRWQVWQGKAIDIWSKSPYPANVLSNLYGNSFCYDGVECGSMEGFLQSLKYKDIVEQRHICRLSGKEAKRMTTAVWQEDQTVWWEGQAIDRQSKMFLRLVRAAYKSMFEQNVNFRTALMNTRGKALYHSQGEQDSHKTILTEKEFCGILTELRDNEKNIIMEFNNMENCTELGNKALYQKLLSSDYEERPYQKEDLGEGMSLVLELRDSYWKPRYLMDNETGMAYEFMDGRNTLVTFTTEDIAWETIERLSKDIQDQARRLNGYYPTIICKYQNGVAEVRWQINPDGRYYMDSDGYGMTDDEEETLYGFVDRKGKPLVKFRRVKNFSELDVMEQEAIENVGKQL